MQEVSRLLEASQQWSKRLDVRLPPLEAPALEIHKLAIKGWLVDPLLIAAPEDTLFFLEAMPSRGNKEEVAEALQDIVRRYESELRGLVDDSLKFLLGEDTQAYLSHSVAFAVALRAVSQGEAVELVTQAMLARTEGIFKESLLIRGYSNRQVRGTLYSSDESRIKIRRKLLENALEQAHERRVQRIEGEAGMGPKVPYWQDLDSAHERLDVACAAFSKGKIEESDELPFDAEGARNHAQHDGMGTETLDWAVRVLLWFAGMALVLSEILPELPLDATVAVPEGDTAR